MNVGMLVGVAGVVALAGLALICRGLWPRRSGSKLFCRRCGYNLAGTDLTTSAARCPECGSALTSQQAIVIGVRRRRWGRVGVGLMLVLVGGTPVVLAGIGRLYQVNYYQYAPLGYVLYEAESGDPRAAARAFAELDRRLAAGPLASDATRRAAHAALVEQGRPEPDFAAVTSGLQLLASLQLRGQLPADLEERFFEQMVTQKMLVPKLAPAGIEFFLGVEQHVCGPLGGYLIECTLDRVQVDQGPALPLYHGFIYPSMVSQAGTQQCPVTIDEPGTHLVTMRATINFRDTAGGSAAVNNPVLYTISRELEVPVEVVPEELAGPVLEANAALDDYVRNNIRINAPQVLIRREGEAWFEVMIFFEGVRPTGFVLTGEAVFAQRRVPLEMVLIHEGGAENGSQGVSIRGEFSGPEPEQATLILRTCRECAMKHPDIERIWYGVMCFANVEVVAPDNTDMNLLIRRYGPQVLRWPSDADAEADEAAQQ